MSKIFVNWLRYCTSVAVIVAWNAIIASANKLAEIQTYSESVVNYALPGLQYSEKEKYIKDGA